MQSDRDKEQTRTEGLNECSKHHKGGQGYRIPKGRSGDSGLDSRKGGDDRPKERVVSKESARIEWESSLVCGCARYRECPTEGDSSTHGLNRDGVVRAGTTNEEFYGYSTQDQHRLVMPLLA